MKKAHQKRYVATHAKIIAAATEVIGENGVENSTIDQIMAKAGLSKGAFFDHFETKLDILEAVKKQLLRENRKLSELNPTIKFLQRNRAADAYVGIARELHRQRRTNRSAKVATA